LPIDVQFFIVSLIIVVVMVLAMAVRISIMTATVAAFSSEAFKNVF